MLPERDRLACREFNQALTDLVTRVQGGPVDSGGVQFQIGQLQHQYQQQMTPILAHAEEVGIPQARSLSTEFQRSLRLLETDGLFLQAAKSPALQQQRLKGVSDRLQTLIGYCQVLLGDNPSEGS